MRLLIFTQSLDRQHPVLGFFHRWVEEFARHTESVIVVALETGDYSLPANVTIYSLGKNERKSRLVYLGRFFWLCWRERQAYDGVFVHMNQLYVLLGGLLWRCWGKQIGLWYAHGAVPKSLYLATWLSHLIFTSTPEGYQLPTKKKQLVGQGIDLELFSYHERRETATIACITDGRIAPVKHLDTLIRALALLREQNVPATLRIVGKALSPAEAAYEAELKSLATTLKVAEWVVWHGPATQPELATLLHEATLYVHDGGTKSLDKALVQAVATGLPTFSSNAAFTTLAATMTPIFVYPEQDVTALVEKIATFLALPIQAQQQQSFLLTSDFRQRYRLDRLIGTIVAAYRVES